MTDPDFVTPADQQKKIDGKGMVNAIAAMQDLDRYSDLSWEGRFED